MTKVIDGYTSTMFDPEKYDTYLVKTEEGCYDFAHFANGEWSKGYMTDGTPFLWREIPQTNQKYKSIL